MKLLQRAHTFFFVAFALYKLYNVTDQNIDGKWRDYWPISELEHPPLIIYQDIYTVISDQGYDYQDYYVTVEDGQINHMLRIWPKGL